MSLFWSLLDLEVVSVKFENIKLKPHSIKSTFILLMSTVIMRRLSPQVPHINLGRMNGSANLGEAG